MVVMVIETFVLASLPSRIKKASWSLFETLRSSIKLLNVVILNRIFSMSSVSYYFVSRKVDVLLNVSKDNVFYPAITSAKASHTIAWLHLMFSIPTVY